MSDDPYGGYWPEHHPLRRIERKLDLLLERQQVNMSTTTNSLANLQAAVANETTIDQSVLTLLTTLAAEIASASPTGDNPAIDAVVATMTANAATLSAAITANTPSTPTP